MEFKLLGPVEIKEGKISCTPRAPKVKQVLALLLLRANQVVSIDSLIEELWGDSPPRSAVTTAQTYIYQLRQIMAGAADGESGRIETTPPGYLLRVDDGELDVHNFAVLVGRAQRCDEAAEFRPAGQYAQKALALWRGRAMADVTLGNLLGGYAVNLEERRIGVLELRVAAEMRLGNYREIIADLRSLVAAHPLNEWFHAQLITALSEVGRRSDALQAYRTVRELLRTELGLEPSAQLREVHRAILTADLRPSAPRRMDPLIA